MSLDRIVKFCGLILLALEIELQIGPSIDARRLVKTGEVSELREGVYGIYIDAENWILFQLFKLPESLQLLGYGPKLLQRLPRNVVR